MALDMVILRFTTAHLTRPLHFFGKAAFAGIAIGGVLLGYGLIRKLVQWSSFNLFAKHGPLMAIGFVAFIAGLLFLSTGLIGALLMRVYFEASSAETI